MAEENEENERMCTKRHSLQCQEVPISEETTCGFGPFRGPFIQKFATKKYYILLYGLIGMWQSASWAYFNGTITTMEKRFKIPSRVSGLIETGSDVSGLFSSIIISYWVGNGHRPRWMAFGILTAIIRMWLNTLPHVIYGPGEDALKLTEEYGGENMTAFDKVAEDRSYLCKGGELCVEHIGSLAQPLILFIAHIIGGIGGGLHYTLGITYIDDNVKKSETPFFISLTFCIRMIGPTVGYAIAATCLKFYIAPTLTPKITNDDPRWMGAWWIGWLVISFILLVLAFPMSLFPKTLPETAAAKILEGDPSGVKDKPEPKPSFRDLFITMKRLFTNKIFLYNNIAAVFYCIGEDPYWLYLTKYIETQYKQTASAANLVSGTIGLGTTAFGILLSGSIISKFKPKARTLAAWNVFIGVLTTFGTVAFVFINCDENNQLKNDWQQHNWTNLSRECRADCGCDYVPYSPVCSENNITYISACHAGCQTQYAENGIKKYSNCSCVDGSLGPGNASAGSCFVDCTKPFYMFLTILSILKLARSSGVASNFLVGVRCIDEKDKSAAMAVSLTFLRVLALAPAPVFYGYLLDTTCLVWGETCTGQGNCWVYDSKNLAYVFNITAAIFLALGTIFDVEVWYHAKSLKIFD